MKLDVTYTIRLLLVCCWKELTKKIKKILVHDQSLRRNIIKVSEYLQSIHKKQSLSTPDDSRRLRLLDAILSC